MDPIAPNRAPLAERRGPTRRRAVALIFASLVFGWAAGIVVLGGISRVDAVCRPCHAMRPYARALAVSGHATTRCVSCHSAEGALGIVVDGVAMQRRIMGTILSRAPEAASLTDDGACRGCHSNVLASTVRGDLIIVRHKDFDSVVCAECHAGTAHELKRRTYSASQMEDCTNCHRTSFRQMDSCGLCHVPGTSRGLSEAQTAWGVTHGPQWQRTHGMGDISSCSNCHPHDYCVDCHGTVIPHPPQWSRSHGKGLEQPQRAECAKCHEATWCVNCHRIEMPHPSGFLVGHAPIAKQTGEALCATCHVVASCAECHRRAEHPDVPGVTRKHKR